MTSRPRLLFLSARFLLPVDSGGKIRTTQILRGLKGGRFDVTLVSPAPADFESRYGEELSRLADRFVGWPQRGPVGNLERLRHLFGALPIPVATDRSAAGSRVLAAELERGYEAVVVDFPHAAVLMPAPLQHGKVIVFTHNVEAEIYARHAENSSNLPWRMLWKNQHAKMCTFERDVLASADAVVAVAERDRRHFQLEYQIERPISTIRTGVDLDYFGFREAGPPERLVFTGSMDWLANIDAIRYFVEKIAPRVDRAVVKELKVVGRAPPTDLVAQASASPLPVRFTGFVDDVRTEAAECGVFVIPLRVGGGTRLKVFEAMAMGLPIVSTSIGVEGLEIEDGIHYLNADTPEDFAAAIQRLNRDSALRTALARHARDYVERECSYLTIAKDFESICLAALG